MLGFFQTKFGKVLLNVFIYRQGMMASSASIYMLFCIDPLVKQGGSVLTLYKVLFDLFVCGN